MATKTQTAQAAATVAQEHIDPVIDTNGEDKIGVWSAVRMIAGTMGYEVPTGPRAVWGAVTMVAVTILGTYSGMQLAGYMAVGAIMLTGSAFIAYALLVLGFLAAFVTALMAASKAGAYVANGQLEKDVIRAKNYITGFFKKAEPKAVTQAA